MKLSGAQITGYVGNPEPQRLGVLIYGPDAMRVALKRQDLIKALAGPEAEQEMRLARLAGSDLRKDPASLLDAIKAQSFFPGPRVVFVEDVTDGLSKPIIAALEEWQDGDGQVILTAGQLRASSALRKFFEQHKNAYAMAVYADPPGQQEIQQMLEKAGLNDVPRECFQALVALAQSLEPGDFMQTIEKLSLYRLNALSPMTVEEVELCAPVSREGEIDEALNCVSEGRLDELAPIMQRLMTQGTQPVTLCISLLRHFKMLFTIASHPAGASQGIAQLRPPLFGPRRNRVQRQATIWSLRKAKFAVELLVDLDLKLRSAGQTAPNFALVERSMIRLAMMARRS